MSSCVAWSSGLAPAHAKADQTQTGQHRHPGGGIRYRLGHGIDRQGLQLGKVVVLADPGSHRDPVVASGETGEADGFDVVHIAGVVVQGHRTNQTGLQPGRTESAGAGPDAEVGIAAELDHGQRLQVDRAGEAEQDQIVGPLVAQRVGKILGCAIRLLLAAAYAQAETRRERQGSLFELPAGSLQAAAGVSYRDIDFMNSPSPANADLVGSFGTNPSSGYDSVKEIYAELLVPVLRAGLGMADATLAMLPESSMGFVGLARDEHTFEPRAYMESLPVDLTGLPVLVLDPMVATGGSLQHCVGLLAGRGATDITVLCAVAAPAGLDRLEQSGLPLRIVTASIDEKLNEKAFIVPGLGDAGDRQFGGMPRF